MGLIAHFRRAGRVSRSCWLHGLARATAQKLTQQLRVHQRYEGKFALIDKLVSHAQRDIQDELDARGQWEYFTRVSAVAALRRKKRDLYKHGHHKVAKIEFEQLRQSIDEFEKRLAFQRQDTVLLYNKLAKAWCAEDELLAATVAKLVHSDTNLYRILLGKHIRLEYLSSVVTLSDEQASSKHRALVP